MSVRRWVGAVVALGVGLALGLHPVEAHASAGGAALEVGAFVEVSQSWCEKPDWPQSTSTSSSSSTIKSIPADNRAYERRVSQKAQGGASMLSASRFVRARYAASAWGTRRVELRASAAVSAGPNPSPCVIKRFNATAAMYTTGMAAPRKSWLVVRSSGSMTGPQTSVVVGLTGDGDFNRVITQPDGSITRLVPAGDYTIGARLEPQITVPQNSTTTRSASANVTASVTLYPIGTLRTFTGTGRSYVRTGHRDCALNRARIDLTAATRKYARKITFSVNGVRRVTMRSAGLQRSSFYLGRIPDASAGAIRAAIVLKSGAKRTMQATTWPCA